MYSPSLHVFHPSDYVSEGDVLPLSSKESAFYVLGEYGYTPWPCVLSGDDWQEKEATRLQLEETEPKQLNYLKRREL